MQIISLSNASDSVIGFAQKRYREADTFRKLANLETYKRVYSVDGLLIIVMPSAVDGRIIITGGSPQIFLTNGSKAYGYSYDADTISDAVIKEVSSQQKAISLYDGRVQIGDLVYSSFDGGWTSKRINSSLEPLGNVNKFELGFMHDNGNIFARHFDSLHDFGVVGRGQILPHLSGAMNNLFSVSYYSQSLLWTLFNGATLFVINPLNKHRHDGWYWTPSFFSVAPADPYQLFGGFYYGEYPASQYGFVSNGYGWFQLPLSEADVRLVAVMDGKVRGGYTYGWAEIVESIAYQGGRETPND